MLGLFADPWSDFRVMRSLPWFARWLWSPTCCLTLLASYLLGQRSGRAAEGPAVVEAPAAAVPNAGVIAPPPNAQAEPFDPERGVPPGYHLEQGVRKWLVLSGAGLFGVSWGLSFVKATGTGGSGDTEGLVVPLVGPFIYAANIQDSGERVAWAVVGAAQLAGATAFILGLTLKTPWIVPNERSVAYVGPMQVGHKGYGGGVAMRF